MNPRAIAMHALMQVARRGSFPDVLLDIYFKENPELDSRDRALITELVYGVLRWQGRLDWVIDQQINIRPEKVALPVRVVLRLAVYQLLFLDRIPAAAAVHEAVELAKASQPQHVVSFVNGVLRSISRKAGVLKEASPEGSSEHRLAMLYSYPVWLVQRWLTQWGAEESDRGLRPEPRDRRGLRPQGRHPEAGPGLERRRQIHLLRDGQHPLVDDSRCRAGWWSCRSRCRGKGHRRV